MNRDPGQAGVVEPVAGQQIAPVGSEVLSNTDVMDRIRGYLPNLDGPLRQTAAAIIDRSAEAAACEIAADARALLRAVGVEVEAAEDPAAPPLAAAVPSWSHFYPSPTSIREARRTLVQAQRNGNAEVVVIMKDYFHTFGLQLPS